MKLKEYKKYEDIPSKYRFDLENILNGQKIENLIEEYFKLLEDDLKIKESKYENEKKYFDYLEKGEKKYILGNRIMNYISNHLSTNVVDPKFNKLEADLQIRLQEFSKLYGSETNLVFKNEEKLRKWIELPNFKNYKKDILFTLENKRHRFSDAIEEFLIRVQRAEVDTYKLFSTLYNSEIDYGYATSSKGKKTKITLQNRISLMKSKDEEIRKTTLLNWKKSFVKHKESFTNILYEHLKNDATWSKERKYKSTVEYLVYEDRVDDKLLQTLFKSTQEHNHLFQKYLKLKKSFFEKKYKKTYKSWDSLLPLVDVKQEYTIEETKELVSSSLKPLGKEYNSVINKMFKENWIDFIPVKNKRSGAYSIGGSYGLEKKYILMNFDGSLRSVSTLSHEAGHSVHSYYSDKNQPFNLSAYPIFLAEIASIFNELMLQDYLLKNNNSDKFKFSLLSESIEDFEGTVRRQTMWANYEYDLYSLLDNNGTISSFEDVKKIYQENYKKYEIKKNHKLKKDEQLIDAVTVPHFYYNFYVYKYAIGFVVANYFFQKYKENGEVELQNYIDKFLKSGCRDFPIEILKDAGIDLYDENIYKEAFKVLENNIVEYERLGKKIIK